MEPWKSSRPSADHRMGKPVYFHGSFTAGARTSLGEYHGQFLVLNVEPSSGHMFVPHP